MKRAIALFLSALLLLGLFTACANKGGASENVLRIATNDFETLEELSPQEEEYMRGKYEKVLEHVEEIDELLNKVSSGWKVNRMSKVDLNILRLAVYEMKYDEDVPFKVAINEAVELSKKFGGDESSSFVNGILGKIAKEQ